jgi:hypothetical protein
MEAQRSQIPCTIPTMGATSSSSVRSGARRPTCTKLGGNPSRRGRNFRPPHRFRTRTSSVEPGSFSVYQNYARLKVGGRSCAVWREGASGRRETASDLLHTSSSTLLLPACAQCLRAIPHPIVLPRRWPQLAGERAWEAHCRANPGGWRASSCSEVQSTYAHPHPPCVQALAALPVH